MVRLILALTVMTCLIMGWSCSNPSPQIKFGTYRQYTSYHYADLEILKGHKFVFNDMRSGSCFAWTKYEGNWTMNKDTLIFTWQTHWEENPVHISSSIDRSSKETNLTFKYEDNEPIKNVEVCYAINERCPGYYHGWRQRNPPAPTDKNALQACRADCGEVPAH